MFFIYFISDIIRGNSKVHSTKITWVLRENTGLKSIGCTSEASPKPCHGTLVLRRLEERGGRCKHKHKLSKIRALYRMNARERERRHESVACITKCFLNVILIYTFMSYLFLHIIEKMTQIHQHDFIYLFLFVFIFTLTLQLHLCLYLFLLFRFSSHF